MTNLRTLFFLIAMLSTLTGMSTRAQILTPMIFKTTFPFYAGNAKMPPGEYRVTQPTQFGDNMLSIESVSGSHSAFVEVSGTNSEQPHAKSDVTFNRYGRIEFLNFVWVGQQNVGVQIMPSKYEQNVAKTGPAEKHALPLGAGK